MHLIATKIPIIFALKNISKKFLNISFGNKNVGGNKSFTFNSVSKFVDCIFFKLS
jgi:hypothetical protein